MRACAIVTLVGAVFLAGCATVVRGQNEQVQFDSDPAGAEMRSIVFYECGGPCDTSGGGASGAPYRSAEEQSAKTVDGPACITPCALQVPRNQTLIVTFSKPGYEPQTLRLEAKPAGGGTVAVAGNAIIGGVVGTVVDVGTGAGLDHQPNPMKAILKPIATPAEKRGPAKRKSG